MKKKSIIIFLLVALLVLIVYFFANRYIIANKVPDPSLNPDPNHTHADFAIWINNEQVDFSSNAYMSGLPTDDDTHDEESEYRDKHLHLHDNIGHVIHRHKPGLTLNDFFRSISVLHADNCLAVQNSSYCGKWQMFINGAKVPFDPSYVFSDLDQVLLTYNALPEQVDVQLQVMTDEACLYSKACPWRGEPPPENCVADPEVPCIAPLD